MFPRPRPPQTFFWLFRRRRVRSKECSLTSIHLRFRLLLKVTIQPNTQAANHRTCSIVMRHAAEGNKRRSSNIDLKPDQKLQRSAGRVLGNLRDRENCQRNRGTGSASYHTKTVTALEISQCEFVSRWTEWIPSNSEAQNSEACPFPLLLVPHLCVINTAPNFWKLQ